MAKTQKKACYKALIVGAGKMGAFFDEPGSDNIFTHAHAYNNHPGFELSGFVDIDGKRARRASRL